MKEALHHKETELEKTRSPWVPRLDLVAVNELAPRILRFQWMMNTLIANAMPKPSFHTRQFSRLDSQCPCAALGVPEEDTLSCTLPQTCSR